MGERRRGSGNGWGGALIAVCAAASALMVTSCFYDSRWGEAKRMQEAAAKHATPKELQATGDANGAALHVMRLRAYATARHAAEVVDWRKQLGVVVEDANRVLGPTLSIRIEVAEAKAWVIQGDEQDLEQLLAELKEADSGEGVDWVVGLAGSLPRAEMSFHQLGMASRPGKHVVLRAMNDAREFEGIRKQLEELAEAERSKLYAARKRHKAATVFLHEIAHTMGVIHQPASAAIMNPKYSTDAERFSDEAAEWMKAALRAREQPPPGDPPIADELLAVLQRTPDSWVPAERDEMIALLRAAKARPVLLAQTGAPGSGPVASGGAVSPAAPVPGSAASGTAAAHAGAAGVVVVSGGAGGSGGGGSALAAGDQTLIGQAESEERAGKFLEAYNKAKPLYAKYPNELAVQDMRCRLIMRLDVPWEQVETECAAFVRLSKAPKK